MPRMNIGDAAAAAGVTPKMIRHYEGLGLIPAPERTDAGYRLYGQREVDMLRFIRQCRGLGFSMPQIDTLLSLWRDPDRHSRAVKALAQEQLAELQARQRELDQMRSTLEQLVLQCRGDHGTECAILERLAVPGDAPPVSPPRATGGTLKQVRPGKRRQQPKAATASHRNMRPDPPSHAALMAWSRSIATAA